MNNRYKHIIEDEINHMVMIKEDLPEIKKDLSSFIQGLPEGVYSLTIIDNLTKETMYFTK